ncbi:delta(1)-pyrroline-2-carboxylate reductase family protein [Deinococcus metallilatus]|uniref:1-piperideine-2-carboxylate/1-pyrroline-2-carboxylate reductase [NAD(P)H] n=1 Tax=Deinococcus metallilatus TaxID=1211322 RepID=A0AAJ5JYX9_9DEIO|nr:bifunctional Delta(1)-pyrroline-2-carboxylate/Delta(1)-piperideine-2-carboxylate reductase [Deinococcus metallilatus]MBB5296850.1 1-piperideine-2-carboxylate/1-pyrroline-2-carboxylate reductase [NAD(P)H] [Deinococcus metallilatus]QBY09583.1 delta(1)-pyrroline-2-carboxylate reductase family protein [Deinococcus metallilatus]RXJ09187.1 delta(1)-pyrroline-2-carboxylate reductase family protein [Deinococcus metallilatus]TLK22769.1 delta(1)-pyrroline-2-carboxylate reductase family protein [Deinoc
MPLPLPDAAQTARLLPYPLLVEALRTACLEYARGEIRSPDRLALPLGSGGVMLSMPAAAPDLASHKLVNVCPANRERGLPTILGQVTAYDAATGVPLFMLDGPTVTARRTAAVSLLGIQALLGTPREVGLIGTGKQAEAHAQAIAAVFPEARLWVKGSRLESAQAFCERLGGPLSPVSELPGRAEVVITATTSKVPVYTRPARPGRLVVAVGAFTPDAAEIAPDTVRASRVYVDDPAGARHEAGDLLQAGVDWAGVHSLADALTTPPSGEKPLLFKTVGCAAWDLAACRVARERPG